MLLIGRNDFEPCLISCTILFLHPHSTRRKNMSRYLTNSAYIYLFVFWSLLSLGCASAGGSGGTTDSGNGSATVVTIPEIGNSLLITQQGGGSESSLIHFNLDTNTAT